MSMYTALSGINAAQSEITATSHNIANVGTFGFKSSRVEFADIFSSSPLSVNRTATGSGVQTARVSQQFSQGNVTATGNVLDLAIEGSGFLPVQAATGQSNETRFTRAGAFNLDADGRIVNSMGAQLMGWPVAADGSNLSLTMGDAVPLTIPPTQGAARRTEVLSTSLTLPTDPAMIGSQAAVPPTAAFSPDDPTSYAYATPVAITNADGEPVNAKLYFVKTQDPVAPATETMWESHLVVDGADIAANGPQTMTFNSQGEMTSPSAIGFTLSGQTITLETAGTKLADTAFRVDASSHDGRTPSKLYSVEVSSDGTIWAGYSSGESLAMGKIFLANFTNPQGMRQMGATALAQTAESGDAILGLPGDSGFGMIRSGSLERSNVDLTQELVNLITAQRNYQASAKAMETSSSLSQTIMNMRS